jgi:hypothetical protein
MAMQAVAGLMATVVVATGSAFGIPALTGAGSGPDVTVPCGAIWRRLPQDLREDLTALRQLPPDERFAAGKQLRQDALDGDYGTRVQQWADRADERRRAIWSRLPGELQRDIDAARALPAAERYDALQEIRATALDGEYGDRVQQVAQRLDERRQACGPDAS